MALESLLSGSQTSNLTQAQNELAALTLIFFIILFVNMRYASLSFSNACIAPNYLLRLNACTGKPTASTQSMITS